MTPDEWKEDGEGGGGRKHCPSDSSPLSLYGGKERGRRGRSEKELVIHNEDISPSLLLWMRERGHHIERGVR